MLRSKTRTDKLADTTHDVKKAVVSAGAEAKDRLPSAPADAIDTDALRSAASDAADTLKDKASAADQALKSKAAAADEVFRADWLPRIQDAVAAAVAGTSSAVAALPEPAQAQVAKVAPSLVPKKRGGLLVLLGLAALGGAGFLYWKGQQPATSAAPFEPAPGGPDDLVGDAEVQAQAELDGPAGKHAVPE